MAENTENGFRQFVDNVINVAKAVGPEIVGAGVGGVAGEVLSQLGAKYDALVNPQIVQALQEHMDWWQIFTSRHAMSALLLNQDPFAIAATVAVGAVTGIAIVNQIRNR